MNLIIQKAVAPSATNFGNCYVFHEINIFLDKRIGSMKTLAMMVLLITGCTAKLEYLSIDQEFTPRQLKVGYLLVTDPVMDDVFLAQGVNASSRDVKQGDPTIQPISDSESQVLGKILLDRIHDQNEKLKADSLERYQKIPPSAIQSLKQTNKASKDIPQGFLNTYSQNFMSFPNPYRFLGTVRIEAESKFQIFLAVRSDKKTKKAKSSYFKLKSGGLTVKSLLECKYLTLN